MPCKQLLPVWLLGLGVLGVVISGPLSSRCCFAEEAAAKRIAELAKASLKAGGEKPKFPEWDKVVDGAKRLEGLFPLYYDEKQQKLFIEIRQDQYDKELILPIAIARGAGLAYLGGDTLNFGDQWLLSFHRAGDRLLVIRHNVRFRADAGTPQADAVKVSYTDSVIKALPIKSEKSGGVMVLIDLADLFMCDLANIGVNPDPARSTWAKVKAFPKNVEIEVSAVFSMMGRGRYFSFFGDDAVADPRGAQVVIHYGLSMLPSTSYKSRLADDRVGHFLSVVKDFSRDVHETPNVHYLTRWNLEKEKSGADKSPPKQPIIFWIERTVPREYRQYVREGILEWNKAFEKVGFIDAIQVRDQQSDDEFDPEDIRYNTFRWITTSAGFAMGPSRTNPKTGEILDADIVFDEGMIRYWRQEYIERSGIPAGMGLLLAGQRQGFFKLFAAELPSFADAEPLLDRMLKENREMYFGPLHAAQRSSDQLSLGPAACSRCQMGPGMQRQLAVLAAVLAAKGELEPGGKVPEKFIAQAVKEVVMHEVGHTLGLRHNFKASSALSLAEVNDPAVTAKKGNSGSIMDYLPANIVRKGQKQGDYFSPTIGAYDYWAIEYAYKPVDGDEKQELAKIAAKDSAPDLTYGTDEDTFLNPDPRINLFDLGDPLDFAKDRIQMVRASLDKLQERVVAKGEGWQRARAAFSALLGELAHATMLSANYVGGEYTCRDHRGDAGNRTSMKPIEIAKQREAIRLLQDEILSAKAFEFKPELLRQLAPDHWYDDGFFSLMRSGNYQYPVLQRVLWIQRIVLARFLSAEVLGALQEISLQTEPGQESLQMAEVFDALTNSIWTEVPATEADLKKNPKIAVSTIRRNLQREYVIRLARLVVGPKRESIMSFLMLFFADEMDSGRAAPADARSLAREHLCMIRDRIQRVYNLKNNKDTLETWKKIDIQTAAHLVQIMDQINKVLNATVEVNEQ
jgi:predicted Zn-dependent protease with MMP-like domain